MLLAACPAVHHTSLSRALAQLTAIFPKRDPWQADYPVLMQWTATRLKTSGYGLAAAAIGLESLAAGDAMPFLPFGSSASLVAAGFILILWRDLSAVAARLSALVFGAWAILLKAPLVIAAPAEGSAWLACLGLLALAVIGLRLAGQIEDGEATRAEAAGQVAWRYPPAAPLPNCPVSRG
jgi:hypothetical protein